MSYLRLLILIFVLPAVSSAASAATITSTPSGGPWFAGATWVGGVVPGSVDDVVIVGPVSVAGVAMCNSAEISPSGTVNGAIVSPPRTFQVSGSITNHGSIGAANPFFLDVEVGGDIYNAGTWAPVRTRLIGSGPRYLRQEPGHGLTTDLAYANGASGDLVATTPITMSGSVDVSAGRLILEPDCPLTLDAASFRGSMLAGGNELRFLSWSYLLLCTIDDPVLVGEANASNGVIITTRLTVMDVLQNGGTSGGGSVIVQGDLVNNGLIRNVQYSFPVYVTGNVENNGNIDCPGLELQGVGAVHHLRMGPEGIINAPVFLPEFEPATLIAETPVRFGDGVGLGVGTLVLEPGASLELVSFGAIGAGTVLAGGNEITVQGSGAISYVTVDQGVFGDHMVIYGENLFTGGLTVSGTVESGPWAAADLTVEGALRNDGAIGDGAHPVRIRALGDLVNHGAFTNSRVTMAGTTDQEVGAGPQGLAVSAFVIESGLDAASHQWYRDGVPLPGETGADLTLSGVAADDYGIYHCEAEGETSRRVIIAETADAAGLSESGRQLVLLTNYPNPFHPSTSFSFHLSQAVRVSLVVYDLAGREVADLAGREMSAGHHDLRWDARNLPSGTYIYRLRAGPLDLSRKCTLLR